MPLQTKLSEICINPIKYLTLIHSDAGVGKTSFCASIPDSYFLSTEAGTKGVNVRGDPILKWESNETVTIDGEVKGPVGFLDKVNEILAAKQAGWNGQPPIKVLIIDTYENLWAQCGEWICANEKFLIKGKLEKFDRIKDIEWGRGYARVNELLIGKITQLMLRGFGVFLLSHTRRTTVQWRKQDMTAYGPNLSGTSAEAITNVCDAIGYFELDEEHAKDVEGQVRVTKSIRRQFWQPAFLRVSKHRLRNFPEELPLPPPWTAISGWDVYCQAFKETVERIRSESTT